MNHHLVFCAALVVLVAGCQSNPGLQAAACPSTNWYELGKADAGTGRLDDLESYKKTCAATNVVPDQAAYGAGYSEGLKTFCTFNNGQNQAAKKVEAFTACPVDSPYFEGHQSGIRIYNENLQKRMADQARQKEEMNQISKEAKPQ